MHIKQLLFFFVFLLLSAPILLAQEISPPLQAAAGPGGSDYQHEEVLIHDFSTDPDGYWLYEPASPRPDSAHVVVFIHGYGAFNPMIYGQWIRHLVRKGNIVLFPRYQKNLFSPKPDVFADNVATAIRDAAVELDTGNYVRPIWGQMTLVGHSYGGVISSYLAVNYDTLSIPKPVAAMLCSPGTGPLKGGRLESYEGMPEELKLLIMVSNNDRTVGDEFGIRVYETATAVRQRNLLRQYPDNSYAPGPTAGHNESYSLDHEFDSGVRNISAKRALRMGKVDAVDYFGYWKLLDALLDCSRSGSHCEYAFGNTPEQRFMGNWSNGDPVRELEVSIPAMDNQLQQAMQIDEKKTKPAVDVEVPTKNF